jgi:hypothetical protein
MLTPVMVRRRLTDGSSITRSAISRSRSARSSASRSSSRKCRSMAARSSTGSCCRASQLRPSRPNKSACGHGGIRCACRMECTSFLIRVRCRTTWLRRATNRRRHSVSLQAGQPVTKGNKRGAACAYNIKELRNREIDVARHAEQAYEQFVSRWQPRGPGRRRTGAANEERR